MKRQILYLGLVSFVLVVTLVAPVQALHDPPGTQANSGTVYSGSSKMVAFVVSGYSYACWSGVTVGEYTGDFDFHGHSAGSLMEYIEFYCLIKIKPADSAHRHLRLKAAAGFWYGISAFPISSAGWEFQFVVVDMGQNPPIRRGWSSYHPSDSIWFGIKDRQHWSPNLAYYTIYSDWGDYLVPYEFSTAQWYYVGIWLRGHVQGWSEFYRDIYPFGQADWDTQWISWSFIY